MDEYNISKIDLSNKPFTKLSNYKECYLIKED